MRNFATSESELPVEVFTAGNFPVVATPAILEAFGLEELLEIWHEYMAWWKNVRPTLPEEEQMFATERKGKKVWVILDPMTWTILFPEEY